MIDERLLLELVRADAPTGHEAPAARLVAQALGAEPVDVEPGRPNVVAETGRGERDVTVLLLGHTDTVAQGGAPLARRDGDLVHGRGAYDMAGGLVAAVAAFGRLHDVAGRVVLAAVCGEEADGAGTKALLDQRRRFDHAIVPEPTDERVVVRHRGFLGFSLETAGVAAHGSDVETGRDAIVAMAPVLAGLGELGPWVHAGLIEGGVEDNTFPARCAVTGEWRTYDVEGAAAALRALADRTGAALRLPYRGAALDTPPDAPVARALLAEAGGEAGEIGFWCDAALLAEAGIPAALLGPAGRGAHADDEQVSVASCARVAAWLEGAVRRLAG